VYRLAALLLSVAFTLGNSGVAAVQPMLLTPGTFSLEQGTNVIKIAAQCLNEHLDIPGSTDVFHHFSDGVIVTRTIGNERDAVKLSEAVDRGWVVKSKGQGNFQEIGIEVNPKEVEKGATFQVDVSADAPQFVATDEDQVDDVERLLQKGGDVLQRADQVVENFVSDQLPQWRSLLGNSYDRINPDELRRDLKQRLVWALRDKPVKDVNEAVQIIGREFGYDIGLPIMDDAPDVTDRLELLLGRPLTLEDRGLIEKLRGRPLPGSSQIYKDCASMQQDPEAEGGGISVFYRGIVRKFSLLEDACESLLRMDEPPRHVILDSVDFNFLDRGILADILADHNFNYVVDPDFFARHGLPQKPKTIIVFGSEDPQNGEDINKIVFGGQPVAGLPRWISNLRNRIGQDHVYCVTNKEELDEALAVSSHDGVLPWIIGHNEDGHFISRDKRPVEINGLHYRSVVVSCSLFRSPELSAPLGLRTTKDLDVQAIMGAIGDAFREDEPADHLGSQSNGDFLNFVWDNYDQDQKRRTRVAKIGVLIVAPTGVITIAYVTSRARPSSTGTPGQPESSVGKTGQPEMPLTVSPEEQAAAAEGDLDRAWSRLNSQQKNAIRQEERDWIKMKERIPINDPRRAEEVRKRARYLWSLQQGRVGAPGQRSETPLSVSPAEQAAAAEQDLNRAWLCLSPQQRDAIRQEERDWIKVKERIPVNDPRRPEEVRRRARYLWSLQEGRDGVPSPLTPQTTSSLDRAEQILNQVYRQLRAGLSGSRRIALKAEEIQWINYKESIPATDPRRVQAIETRIDYLRSWRQSH
jgi:hypothetical protein